MKRGRQSVNVEDYRKATRQGLENGKQDYMNLFNQGLKPDGRKIMEESVDRTKLKPAPASGKEQPSGKVKSLYAGDLTALAKASLSGMEKKAKFFNPISIKNSGLRKPSK